MSDRNAERNPLKRNILLLLLSAAVLLAIAAATLLLPGSATAPDELPPAQAVDAGDVTRVAEGCELLQTLTYTRCEHVVTRRVTAPAELYGKTLDEVAALYPEWRITEFGASLIKMEQQPDMFCPDHMVLMPNGGTSARQRHVNRFGSHEILQRLALHVARAALKQALR